MHQTQRDEVSDEKARGMNAEQADDAAISQRIVCEPAPLNRRVIAVAIGAVVLSVLAARAWHHGPTQFMAGPSEPTRAMLGDEFEYTALAVNLKRGHGYVATAVDPPETFPLAASNAALQRQFPDGRYHAPGIPDGFNPIYRTPGYPVVVASIFAVFGEDQRAVRIIQWLLEGIIGGLIVVLALVALPLGNYALAVGATAGFAFAVLPLVRLAPNFSDRVLTETVATVWLTIVAIGAVAVLRWPKQQWWLAIATGTAITAMLLTRGALIAVPPAIALAMLIGAPRRRVGPVAVMTIVALGILAPWSIYASAVRGHPVVLSAQGAIGFCEGNSVHGLDGDWRETPAVRPADWNFPPDALPAVQEYEFRARHGFSVGLRFLLDHPSEIVPLIGRRLAKAIGNQGVLWGLAGFAVVTAWFRRTAHAERVAVLAAVLLGYLVVSAAFYGVLRFITPFMPVMTVLAVAGVFALGSAIYAAAVRARRPRRPPVEATATP